MFSYDGSKRPTIDEIRAHPWMQAPCDMKQIRSDLLTELSEKRSAATADTSREDVNSRGDSMLDLVKQTSMLQYRQFNDMTDYHIDVVPGVIFDDLNTYNAEYKDGKLVIEKLDNKHIIITQKDENSEAEGNAANDLVVKVKFFCPESEANEEGAPSRTRVRFTKKRGDINEWYAMF